MSNLYFMSVFISSNTISISSLVALDKYIFTTQLDVFENDTLNGRIQVLPSSGTDWIEENVNGTRTMFGNFQDKTPVSILDLQPSQPYTCRNCYDLFEKKSFGRANDECDEREIFGWNNLLGYIGISQIELPLGEISSRIHSFPLEMIPSFFNRGFNLSTSVNLTLPNSHSLDPPELSSSGFFSNKLYTETIPFIIFIMCLSQWIALFSLICIKLMLLK